MNRGCRIEGIGIDARCNRRIDEVSSVTLRSERKQAVPKRSVVERFVFDIVLEGTPEASGEVSVGLARSRPLIKSSEKADKAAIESAQSAS